jgi:CheY-like chemotaxis protein
MKNHPYTVLLAEDDLDDQYFLKVALHEINPAINLTIAYDGVHALNFFLKKESLVSKKFELPKFIITDLNMPRIDGFEFIEKIKQDENLKHIPIFVFTTSNDERFKEKALQLGAAGYFIKPLDIKQFKPIIQQMVDKANKK